MRDSNLREIILSYLKMLLLIPSPSGDTNAVAGFLVETLEKLGFQIYATGENTPTTLRVRLDGGTAGPVLAWVSHADTLGVRVVKNYLDNSHLLPDFPGVFCWVERVGGADPYSLLNQTVVFKRTNGDRVTGTLLYRNNGAHMAKKGKSALTSQMDERNDGANARLLCRLDAPVHLPVGTFGSVVTELRLTDDTVLSSRYLDSKADVAVMLALLTDWKQRHFTPPHTVDFVFNLREEVSQPATFAKDTTHAVALEFIPSELGCDLSAIGLVEKDSFGPSDDELTTWLKTACHTCFTPPALYTIPSFFSDSSLAKQHGARFKAATLGFGMDQSHGNERTDVRALEAMVKVMDALSVSTLSSRVQKAPA